MFICSICSAQAHKWQGRCASCQNWNVLVEAEDVPKKASLNPVKGRAKKPVPLSEMNAVKSDNIYSGFLEWDNVVGGGITPGSMIILTGDPGVGKSTLMLQIADAVAAMGKKVLYFSSEESLQQLRNKVTTLGLTKTKVLFSDEGNVLNIIETLKEERPAFAVIDSLQNCRLDQGGAQNYSAVAAIKETAHQLMLLAKQENIALVMTGHITKEGVLAGPKLLEHLVDAVFYLQNDPDSQKKILVSVKNRFGPIDEMGFFELGEQGFSEVHDVNQALLDESSQKDTLGSALFLSFKGSRCLLSEFQALCLKNHGNIPQRIISGVDPKKVLIIAALLEKYLKLDLGTQDIFFKIKGGLKISENYSDLAIALTILSSVLKEPLPYRAIVAGEINLSGRISIPPGFEKILKNSKKLGLDLVIVGAVKDKPKEMPLRIFEVSHVYELLGLFEGKLTK
jgi:DNA repair protein RadA/Sms